MGPQGTGSRDTAPERGAKEHVATGHPTPGPAGHGSPGQGSAEQASGAVLRVSRSLAIPLSELEWRTSTPGGPGGQHANRTQSRVEVRFDVEASHALGPRQRATLLGRLGPVVTATASDERSQARNRQLALERMAGRLSEALRVRRPRRPTAPTAAAKARRLDDKRRRAAIKRRRRPPGADD
jgi:ribosome-associated protein